MSEHYENLITLSRNSKSLWQLSHDSLCPSISQLSLLGTSLWAGMAKRMDSLFPYKPRDTIALQKRQDTSISNFLQIQVAEMKFLTNVAKRSGLPLST